MRVLLVGAPGAGKGTQAKLLKERLAAPHISSGDLLRDAVRRGTDLGMKAKAYMERGQLVPDSLLIGAMRERLRESDCRQGFLLDGFPRTVRQAEALEEVLSELSTHLDAVIILDVPVEALVARLSGRRTCRECGAMFHVQLDPPTVAGVCNRCSGELYQREDDRETTIRERLSIYERTTKPLLNWYEHRGTVATVNGVGEQREVLDRILTCVEARA